MTVLDVPRKRTDGRATNAAAFAHVARAKRCLQGDDAVVRRVNATWAHMRRSLEVTIELVKVVLLFIVKLVVGMIRAGSVDLFFRQINFPRRKKLKVDFWINFGKTFARELQNQSVGFRGIQLSSKKEVGFGNKSWFIFQTKQLSSKKEVESWFLN